MDHYLIWVNLSEPSRDLEFVENVRAYLRYLKDVGDLESYTITRRKLGWAPPEMGEFMIDIGVTNLAKLEDTFQRVATRSGQVEQLHRAVFTMVTDFKSALYRDFPDGVRKRE